MRRQAGIAAALVAAATTGVVATVAVRGGQAPASIPAAPPVTTATVVRTNLATTVLTAGTLGYAATNPVVNQLAGTYTALPAPGQAIRPGQLDAVAAARQREQRRDRHGQDIADALGDHGYLDGHLLSGARRGRAIRRDGELQ